MALNGQTAVVTGATSGIGACVARQLIEAGCNVVATGRSPVRLAGLADQFGERVYPLALDVTDARAVAGFPAALPEGWRGIDMLVNNAGHDIGGRRRFDEGDVQGWTDIIDTNVNGMFRVTHAVVPGMLERGRGQIINIGSVSGFRPRAGDSVYAASKYAVHGFSESLRLDYADTGIRVTEILPGLVKTGFAATRFGDQERGRQYYEDFGLCLEPEDIARTVLFAVSQPEHVVIQSLVVAPRTQR